MARLPSAAQFEQSSAARRYGLWLHLDAAYAGPAAILEEYRHILDGAALADALVLNPHKWLFTPMDLSVLYTRRPEVFSSADSRLGTFCSQPGATSLT